MSEHDTPEPTAEHGAPDSPPDRPPDLGPDTRSLTKEVEIEAPAEAVWKALSEAEELVRWFPLQARVEPGEGGTIWLSWGEGVAGEARIDAWEPERRLRWIEGETMAVDVTIEGSGGTSVVRLVQSGFSADSEWDDYYDATDAGWTFFLHNLKHYLERHPATGGEVVHARRATERSREDVWATLVGPEGLDPEPPLDEGAEPARGGGAGAEAGTTHSVSLGGEPRELAPWMVRPGRALAGRLPELDDATLIVEMEPGSAERWHCGFWLYTWGLSAERTEALQEGLDALARRVTG